MSHLSRRKLFKGFFIGLLLGAFTILGLRFALVKQDHVHYHANFGLFINGVRDEFKSFTFYEEVASCFDDELNNPKTRVHMHNQINHVVHVHDAAATWGHMFANLGYSLGDDLLKTDQGVFVDGHDGKKLTFLVNGEKVDDLANRLIKSEDVVLISYGSDDETVLQIQQMAITPDAPEYNHRDDPSSCTGSKSLTVKDRLQKTFNLSQ